MDGPHSAWELEIRQLVMLGLVGLIAGQGQGLVFVRETLKYSKVHKLLIVNLNLDEVVCASDHLAPELHGLKGSELLVFPLFQLGLHLGEGTERGTLVASSLQEGLTPLTSHKMLHTDSCAARHRRSVARCSLQRGDTFNS